MDFLSRVTSTLRHRQLLLELVKRDVQGRYRGSFGGLLWSFAYPVFMLAVYTVVFGGFFGMRWGGAGSTLEFSLVLFVGLIVFNFAAECVTRAPGLVLANPNYVKKVVFPLELFPVVVVVSALFHGAVSFVAWIAFHAVLKGPPPATVVLGPLVLLAFVPFVLGCSWLLAAVGAYVRDVQHVTAIAVQALLFLSPVFFSLDAVPPSIRPLLLANPLTLVIEQARAVMLEGRAPDWAAIAVYAVVSTIFCWAGFTAFQRLRPGFADVV